MVAMDMAAILAPALRALLVFLPRIFFAATDFLDWMDPLFKEGPLDWSLEDYVSDKKLVIPIFPMIRKVTKN
jgi:hypothetical protein